MYDSERIKNSIEEGLKGATADVKNPRGDQEHFIAEVVYSGFEGKSLVEQHRMVYDSIESIFKEGLHSLSLKTKIK